VRVFGEIVALLWADRNASAAIALEDLWNELAVTRSFELLCAYPLSTFAGEESTAGFHDVCQRHSAITNESFAELSGSADAHGIVFLQREPPLSAGA